ncbi:MAG TPA: hypothetical protein VL027_01575 [Spongiibacteraceae bacterium]|jgi:hypothetical protein|nr:hypothetical protein [Spongiibacteraceae bacterium]HUH36611.1 hypothetical protein [Spongiibacteraceae bacterium]
MLSTHLQSLQQTIHSALVCQDPDLYRLAGARMERLLDYLGQLPAPLAGEVHAKIDQMLPFEWPLWMESCRFEGSSPSVRAAAVLH